MSACIASLLELPIEAVPYFMGDDVEEPASEWWARLNTWLAPFGFYALNFRVGTGADAYYPPGLYIAAGPSPRAGLPEGAMHAVVARGRDILHDPHPSRAGIPEIAEATLLVPADPARWSAELRGAA